MGEAGPSGADLLVRAGQLVLGARRARAAEHGLSLTAVRVLEELARAGGGLVQRELAARVRITPPTLTPVLDVLEAAGLATRTTDGVDRRLRRVVITGPGHARLRDAVAATHGPRLPEPPAAHADAVREYLVAVIAFLEQDRRDAPL
ncbi:MarR family winged helix-turn-helix transcriptional regulator [Pseudonocardia sp. HH130630-07]|uniref:MarR family winged helix-turn-helix transcriptional regulator n=1 Tax=Pseudonocardia sp. HH130630-07 TaxID=1690815 RepID=UPI00081512BB|nr:MarR family transcriptional regulator [Pseudonocardia sp. HH130630-07]ANY07598.1 hypothetical protein AFB00_16310 [Pseudonocardia sp. HH130630-07]